MELYKKYRPNSFDEMIGNESVISNLKSLIEKGDKHVFLFTGQSGCGKSTSAFICMKMLKINKLSMVKINSSNNRGIDTARQIIEQIKSYPIEGDKWGFIIEECHMTTKEWQNAMLDELEFVPSHVYFFLCTTNPEKLLLALKNRCTTINFPPLQENDLMRLLKRINRKEDGKADNDIIEKIINMSYGSARKSLVLLEKIINEDPERALEILKNEGDEEETEEIRELCRALIGRNRNWGEIAEVLNKLKDEDLEKIRRCILGYMNAVLLKGKENNRAGLVLEFFQEPFYNSGFPGLTLACYQSIFVK